MRDTPRLVVGLGGYHFAALAVLTFGVIGWIRRQRTMLTHPAMLIAYAP